MSDNDYSDSEDDAESIKGVALFKQAPAVGPRRSIGRRHLLHRTSRLSPRGRSRTRRLVSVRICTSSRSLLLSTRRSQRSKKCRSKQTSGGLLRRPRRSYRRSSLPPSSKPGLYRVGSTNRPSIPVRSSSYWHLGACARLSPRRRPANTPMSSVFRESSSGTGSIRRPVTADRQSIESLFSAAAADDAPSRSRVPSSSTNGPILASMDKTRPPVMSLPPPPKLPPPLQ